MGEPQISMKERFIIYLYLYIYIYINIYNILIHIYIHKYLYIELIDRYFTRVLLDKISLVIFLKLSKSNKEHLSAAERLQLFLFLATFNNVSQIFHLSNFNNIRQQFFSKH